MNEGFQHHRAFLTPGARRSLVDDIHRVLDAAPLFTPLMPRSGRPFSVAMSNCGSLGWVSDVAGGYRYQVLHPKTLEPWPPIPASVLEIWRQVADYAAQPEACLINFYASGAKMGSHRDTDERDFAAPVVSISLGDDALFHIGGLKRSDPRTRVTLKSGDVAVLGGPARRAYHGIDRVLPGTSDLLPGGGRINLTLRRVNLP